MASPKLEPVVLSDEERSVLTGWVRRKTAQALALRSRIVLACSADGATIAAVSSELEVSRATVSKWRLRFLVHRLEGLADEKRPGRPRTIIDEKIEHVIVKTLEEVPSEDTHCSTRGMAAATGMSQSAISRIWRAFGLKPHAVETWKLSTDPQFLDKVRDVVGLYMDPPENALVLAVDEKPQMQAIDRTAPILPVMPDHAGADDPRLRPARHHQPVRRDGRGQRVDDRPPLPPAPAPGVPAVPQADRRRGAEGPGPAPGAGQLRHPQDPGRQDMASQAPPVPRTSHPPAVPG